MRTCQVTYVFLVGARFWYGVPRVDHNDKSGATFVFHIVMQIGNQSKCRSLLQTGIIMKSMFGSQKWIGSNCFTLCTSWFSRNRLFPLVCSLKDCMAYLHYSENHHGGFCEQGLFFFSFREGGVRLEPENSIVMFYTSKTVIGRFWSVKFRAQVIDQWETRVEYKNIWRDPLSW